MPRYKLTIEYDGDSYAGWQRQENASTVQGTIEAAVNAFCGQEVTVFGAGRTDAGVHALAQVAHVDLEADWPAGTVRDAVNAHLAPERVALLNVETVADDFDARFSATRRHYLYRILDRRAPAVLRRGRVWRARKHLDADAMHEAAQVLVGHFDFTTFRHANCQAKSPMKTLEKLDVRRVDDEIHVTTASRSYLHSQVRSMVGSLKLVGEGKWTADDLRLALEATDRKACGPVAPSDGLYLTQVDYGDKL